MDTGISIDDAAELGAVGALLAFEPLAALATLVIVAFGTAVTGRGRARTRQGLNLLCLLSIRLLRALERATRPSPHLDPRNTPAPAEAPSETTDGPE